VTTPADASEAPRHSLASAARAAPFALAAAAGAAVVGVASASGGFFPTSWGWAALAFSWAAALALLLRPDSDVGWLDLGFFGLLALFVGWIWLSASWSQGAANSFLEGERGLVALTGVGAALVAVTRRTVPHLLGAVAAAITLVAAYGLATRLFPSAVGRFDPIAGYRLQEPLGYWNALGIFSAVGALLCFAFAARGRSLAARALGGGALAFLLPTIYFTFSRGSWLALAIGAGLAFLVDPRRLQLAASLLALAPVLALEVLVGSRQDALTHQASALAAAEHDGKRYALVVIAVALITAAVAIAFARLERAIDVPRAARLAFAGAIAVLVLVAVVAAFARYGAPQTMARNAWDSFKAPPTPTQQNLNERLFSFSGNGRVDLWKAAWHDHEANPTLGSGAGTFYEWWYEHRPYDFQVLDAHSLYAETIGELGPIGLALLALALLVPVAAAIAARRQRLVPIALGAYVAYVVHAGVDWDWEMTGLTLAAMLVAAGLVASARPREPRPLGVVRRTPLVAAAVAMAALAFVVLVGNLKLARAHDAAADKDWAKSARDARSASDWAPWSSAALRALGTAQRKLGENRAAVATLREAVRKDPSNSDGWYDLYLAASGAEANRAFVNAVRLNPFGFDDKDRRRVLGTGSG
jgi:tetratricopeptide (TPR) repeat protein